MRNPLVVAAVLTLLAPAAAAPESPAAASPARPEPGKRPARKGPAKKAASEQKPAVDRKAAPAIPSGGKAWREARWGMTSAEVEKAFGGEVVRFKKPATLNDGNVIPVGIEKVEVDGTAFEARFIFTDDRLALVSLRTFQDKYADASVYERLRGHLGGEHGGPGEETKDDAFFDLRQTRWQLPESQVDLKYIPGVVVILYSPPATR